MTRRAAGLTLVEMLVVLTLLAIAAGVAVTATEGLAEQARHDATRSALAEVEEAILGVRGSRQPDGTPLVTGFVADLGRLPRFADGPDAGRRLSELWLRPVGVPDCGPQQPRTTDLATVLDADVVVVAGWRGPYLRLPLGAAALLDGWGHALRPLAADGTALTADGAPVEIVRSVGADGAQGGLGAYDLDLDVALARTVPPMQAARHLGSVSGTIVPAPGGAASVVVRVYGPVEGVVHDLAVPLSFAAAGGPQSFTFPDLPVGARALRAYQTSSVPGRDQAFPAAVTHRSRVVHLVIPAGGASGIELDLE